MTKESAITPNSTQHVKTSEQFTNKKTLIAKTIQVGTSTLMSRVLGLVRELLTSRFLGVGEMADAFFTAFKIPNSLRKIFAEGALSAACIPTFVSIMKKGSKKEVSALMTLSFLIFEGILLIFCGLICWKAEFVIRLIAPGWYLIPGFQIEPSNFPILGSFFTWLIPAWYVTTAPLAQAEFAITYTRILIAFIMFLSSSALLAGALQSVNHFFVSAFGPVLLNIFFVGGLLACLKFGFPVEWLCAIILLGGFAQFVLHVYMYFKLKFNFCSINQGTMVYFKQIMTKFLPCLLSMSILEINLFVSTTLATYLPKGSIALINYSNRFMGIPLGVLVGAFSTILLPYFSRISTYAPKRLSICLFEASKMVFWLSIPCTLIMSFLAEKIFHTIFLSEKFSLLHVQQAATLLITFLTGLFFFSLYKILLNVFYALHDTRTPLYASIIVLVINYLLCKLFTPWFGVTGLALAFVVTNIIHVTLFAFFLYKKFNFTFYFKAFGSFVCYAAMQILFIVALFIMGYYAGEFAIYHVASQGIRNFLLYKFGFWLWVGPLCAGVVFLLIKTRKLFNVRLYFLD